MGQTGVPTEGHLPERVRALGACLWSACPEVSRATAHPRRGGWPVLASIRPSPSGGKCCPGDPVRAHGPRDWSGLECLGGQEGFLVLVDLEDASQDLQGEGGACRPESGLLLSTRVPDSELGVMGAWAVRSR